MTVCLLAFGLIGMFLSSKFVKSDNNIFKKFKNSMSPYQKQIYQKIINERRYIFFNSLLLGLIIAILSSYWFYKNKKLKTPFKNLGCYFVAVTLFITYVGYMLYPKSKYILNYLTNHQQISDWLKIYKKFRNYNYIGLILGIFVFYIINNFYIN